jgi:hypothetical protein
MSGETWYRGESEGVAPSRPGGSIHDLGDGVYYTDTRGVAVEYAKMRSQGDLDSTRAYEVEIDVGAMKVLDLTKDPRWSVYLRERVSPRDTMTREQMMRSSELYGQFFEEFLEKNNINVDHYDAVIGPEINRGGKQMCVRYRNGRPTPLHERIRSDQRLFYRGGKELPPPISVPTTEEIFQMKSPLRRAAGIQGAAAVVGFALGEAAMWLEDLVIRSQVREQIDSNYARAIDNVAARGDGLLVIVVLEEWAGPDDAGRKKKYFLMATVRGARTAKAAVTGWAQDVLAGRVNMPSPTNENRRRVEKYAWFPPAR